MSRSRFCAAVILFAAVLSLAAGSVRAADEAPADKPAAAAAEHAADTHADAAHAADSHAAGDTHAAGHHEEHETGVPMNFKGDLALWSLVTFLLFVVVLGKFAWGPLLTALNQREAGIQQQINDAEANRVKSETLLKQYQTQLAQAQEEVKALIAEARRDAETTKNDIMATAQREADNTRQRAVNDIERARDVALGELFDFVSKNVVQATEQVLQRSLTGEDHDRLVRDALAQVDVRKN